MGSRIVNSLWLIEVDPHRGGSISLRPDVGEPQTGPRGSRLSLEAQCTINRDKLKSARHQRRLSCRPNPYTGLLEAMHDPQHPEHEARLEWVGGEFDSNFFDLDEVNTELQSVK